MPLLAPKIGLLYRYSVGGYRYCGGDLFWVWVPQWVSCWKEPYFGLPDEDDDYWNFCDEQRTEDLQRRLAVYRIRAHKVNI